MQTHMKSASAFDFKFLKKEMVPNKTNRSLAQLQLNSRSLSEWGTLPSLKARKLNKPVKVRNESRNWGEYYEPRGLPTPNKQIRFESLT